MSFLAFRFKTLSLQGTLVYSSYYRQIMMKWNKRINPCWSIFLDLLLLKQLLPRPSLFTARRSYLVKIRICRRIWLSLSSMTSPTTSFTREIFLNRMEHSNRFSSLSNSHACLEKRIRRLRGPISLTLEISQTQGTALISMSKTWIGTSLRSLGCERTRRHNCSTRARSSVSFSFYVDSY
jgi:hypothetical protein